MKALILSGGTGMRCSGAAYEELIKIYNPTTNPFLYEFLMHVFRRNSRLKNLPEINDQNEKNEIANVINKENLLLEKYFGNTLKHSILTLSDEKIKEIKETASFWKGDYISTSGKIITSFNLKTAWAVILITLIIVWTAGQLGKKHLDN